MSDDSLSQALVQGTIRALAENPAAAEALGKGIGLGISAGGAGGPSPLAGLTAAQITTLGPAVEGFGRGFAQGAAMGPPPGTPQRPLAERNEAQKNAVQLAEGVGRGVISTPPASTYVKVASIAIILASGAVIFGVVFNAVRKHQ